MATRKEKLAIIEDLSNRFIDENAKTYAKNYLEHLNIIQLKAVDRVLKGNKLTIKSLRKGLVITGINRNTRNAYIMSASNLLIANDKDNKLKRKLNYIVEFNKYYSPRNPKQYAAKVDKLVQRKLGKKIKLNPREQKAYKQVSLFLDQNKEDIQKLVKTNTKALKAINKRITTNESRLIIKRRKQLINERIEVNGVKRPLTNKEIATRLRSEFKNDSYRLERILQTEVHRQDELVSIVQAKGQGYKWKTWNTQRDSRVRETHEVLDRKTIPINAMFNVGGFPAQQPGASTLPPHESISCRCFLTFSLTR